MVASAHQFPSNQSRVLASKKSPSLINSHYTCLPPRKVKPQSEPQTLRSWGGACALSRDAPLLSPHVFTSFEKQPEHLGSHDQPKAVCHGVSSLKCTLSNASSDLVHLFFVVSRVGEGKTIKKKNQLHATMQLLLHSSSALFSTRYREGEVTLMLPLLSPPQSPLPLWANLTSATTVAGATNSKVPWRSTRRGATTTYRVSALMPKLWLASQVGLWVVPVGRLRVGPGVQARVIQAPLPTGNLPSIHSYAPHEWPAQLWDGSIGGSRHRGCLDLYNLRLAEEKA